MTGVLQIFLEILFGERYSSGGVSSSITASGNGNGESSFTIDEALQPIESATCKAAQRQVAYVEEQIRSLLTEIQGATGLTAAQKAEYARKMVELQKKMAIAVKNRKAACGQ